MITQQTQHGTTREAIASFEEMFREVHSQPKLEGWLGVVIFIDGEGKMHMKRTTWTFPLNAWPQAIEMLKEVAMADRPTDVLTQEPLPVAEKFL